MNDLKITVLFPTRTESKYFDYPGVTTDYTGVGLTASAYSTLKAIYRHRPDILIMAGIAGVYPHSSLKIGETVLVSAEHEADLGFFYPEGFRHISDMELDMEFETNGFLECPYIKPDMPLQAVRSNSMNAAMAPFVKVRKSEIENMEGSAFFYVCLKEKQPFYEIRSVSNVVDPAHNDWDYEQSIRNMTGGLYKLLDYLLEK